MEFRLILASATNTWTGGHCNSVHRTYPVLRLTGSTAQPMSCCLISLKNSFLVDDLMFVVCDWIITTVLLHSFSSLFLAKLNCVWFGWAEKSAVCRAPQSEGVSYHLFLRSPLSQKGMPRGGGQNCRLGGGGGQNRKNWWHFSVT